MARTRTAVVRRLGNLSDNQGWQEFFDNYGRLILSFAIKCGVPPSDAEDVLQETLISVARKMPGFVYDRSKGSFRSWLMKLTKRRIIDHFRKVKVRVELPVLDEDLPEALISEGNMELQAAWNTEWKAAVAQAALNKVRLALDPKVFQMFHFSVNKNWPVTKIAQTFAVSTNQVYLAKSRTLGLLRVEIKRLARGCV